MLPQNKRPAGIDEYVNATSLAMALEALADGNGTPLAGGSDLWLQKDSGNDRIRPRLVNINRVAELHGISQVGQRIRIGALVSVSEILESALLKDAVPLLPATADRFASIQIRNAATIGGNIANASPAADMVLPLIALDAAVKISSWAGKEVDRKIPLTDFFTGPGMTRLERNELITAIEFETPAAGFHAVFCKSGPRPALEISLVAMCLAGTPQNGTLRNPRICFGAVGPTPIRCRSTEKLIDLRPIDDSLIAKALATMQSEISPIDDIRASKWYRAQVARTYLEQELMACRSL
ncbi:MAG: xanthine dehydrogenase family protein subunit M [Hyphomicrobiales bacterium]|nr:xanthine dehydrogenase family protein subunit M [Hyphomicrobiales bacterium]MCP4998314.1 xanthine dehydrogenase family protein subunit M [Hyphomicrobiales bacterium]